MQLGSSVAQQKNGFVRANKGFVDGSGGPGDGTATMTEHAHVPLAPTPVLHTAHAGIEYMFSIVHTLYPTWSGAQGLRREQRVLFGSLRGHRDRV